MSPYPAPTRKFYDLRDGRISAVHYGLSSNPVKLIMLNANGFNGYSYKTILEPLGVHAIALDLRGHGMSELPINPKGLKNWHDIRDDIIEFFDRYIDAPVIIAGHSFGAVIGMLALPEVKNNVSGYVGFDPVILPEFARLILGLPGVRGLMKKQLPIARNAGRRKASFDSFESAFSRYHNRGAFRGFTDEALHDYLTGGLIPEDQDEKRGVKLSCSPKWEQAIFVAQGHNTFKAAKALPRKNSHFTFAGKHGVVSFKNGRRKIAKIVGTQNVIFDEDLAHMFPMQVPEYAIQRLKESLARASLSR